jgi:hypothetical protein
MIELAQFNPLEWVKDAFFGGIITDINYIVLAFKIVVLLFIISFVRSRFGGGPLATAVAFIIGYVALFTDYFYFFGPIVLIYLFIAFGFVYMLLDIVIVKPWRKMEMEPEEGGSRDRELMRQKSDKFKRMMGER